MKKLVISFLVVIVVAAGTLWIWVDDRSEMTASLKSCVRLAMAGPLKVADDRADRFLGKVQLFTARCRGGEDAVAAVQQNTPWADWSNYWATGGTSSRSTRYDAGLAGKIFGAMFEKIHVDPNMRGIDGALIDLEYARVELIKFNLFDNYTYPTYLTGKDGLPGPAVRQWDEMRLPAEHVSYDDVGGSNEQVCAGHLIRFRTVSGICNDIQNPLMGSSNMLFARNVQFAETFPDLGHTDLTRARHAGRISLMQPDPQLVSRRLFTREQSRPDLCNEGQGLDGFSADAHCDYKPAPFFNVLAAFWIQFMTHDWFSHLQEGENDAGSPMMSAGCSSEALERGANCRQNDQVERALVADSDPADTFSHNGATQLARAHKTFKNSVTAWWDASQIYGFDEVSQSRVKRDPSDRAKLLMRPREEASGSNDGQEYLPFFSAACADSAPGEDCDNIHRSWAGQEAAGFPDNWTIGLSFYHNVFSREHNVFVDTFRRLAAANPGADSGLRNPDNPDRVITYADVSDDELYEVARLVIAAEIAKVHTIEWTTQLLYNDPLFRAMNSNWSGLFKGDGLLDKVLEQLVVENFGDAEDVKSANHWYSVLAAGPGIFGLGSKRYANKATVFERMSADETDVWTLHNAEHINGGTNHFGSPFNFPEEFTTVYRLHPLVPDLLELRNWQRPNSIEQKIPTGMGFRETASHIVRQHGLADWAVSMGRQRLGLLTLGNHAQFLQNLSMPRLNTETNKVDIAALDLIRDRERGVPRFNEFRRQYGLKQLSSFDDFVNKSLPEGDAQRAEQELMVERMREVYGQHICDSSLVISHAQRDENGDYPSDCLGHEDGTLVDNIEDLDTVVGWLAEPVRPHGYAISETQFVVFILNASRRLFSDRFFTSSFRPEFYTSLGHEWVMNNGPDGVVMEQGASNGHEQEVSPMKRILQRTVPELTEQLEHVTNVFDPWARERGDYYSLEWAPQEGAESDPAFAAPNDD